MIMTMLFEENHSDTINNDDSEQRCLFISNIDFILANKFMNCFQQTEEDEEMQEIAVQT
jgi:hypothetical protein